MRRLAFDRLSGALLTDRNDLAPILQPMLASWRQLREQVAVFDKSMLALAKKESDVPPVDERARCMGLLVLAYVSTVENPSRLVGARMRLTLWQHQSDEVERSGRILRCGDTLARMLLGQTAVVILARVRRASPL